VIVLDGRISKYLRLLWIVYRIKYARNDKLAIVCCRIQHSSIK